MISYSTRPFAREISPPLRLRNRMLSFAQRPAIMGILNINDDSFSGDGRLDPDWAIERALAMVAEGADIIDIGAESARTNRQPIPESIEIARVIPFMERWPAALARATPRDAHQIFPPVLSLNTWREPVARELLPLGFELLNDMSGLPDASNARVCAENQAALLIMHTIGLPKQNHSHVTHKQLLPEMVRFFRDKIRLAVEAGVPADAIVLDPGFGFAKQAHDDLKILANLEPLLALNHPILLPISRKGFIGRTLGLSNPAERDAGTIAVLTWCLQRGGAIFRMHNVDAAWRVRRTLEAFDNRSANPST